MAGLPDLIGTNPHYCSAVGIQLKGCPWAMLGLYPTVCDQDLLQAVFKHHSQQNNSFHYNVYKHKQHHQTDLNLAQKCILRLCNQTHQAKLRQNLPETKTVVFLKRWVLDLSKLCLALIGIVWFFCCMCVFLRILVIMFVYPWILMYHALMEICCFKKVQSETCDVFIEIENEEEEDGFEQQILFDFLPRFERFHYRLSCETSSYFLIGVGDLLAISFWQCFVPSFF